MEQSVIKELATPELKDKIEEQEELLTKLVMNHAVATIENPMKIRYTRRAIARLKTEWNKRVREDGGQAEKPAEKAKAKEEKKEAKTEKEAGKKEAKKIKKKDKKSASAVASTDKEETKEDHKE